MMSPSLSIVKKELDYLNELNNFVTTGINMTNSIASDFQLSKELPREEVQVLEECMLDFIKLERDMKQFLEAACHVKDKVSESSQNNESFEIDETLDAYIRELARKNNDQALKQHEAYEKFLSLIQNINDGSDKILGEEEDMIVVKQSAVTTDPITKQEIRDPVRNVHCRHVYSRDSILQYMKTKDKVRCPYVGCSNQHPLNQKDMRNSADFLEKK